MRSLTRSTPAAAFFPGALDVSEMADFQDRILVANELRLVPAARAVLSM